MDHLCHLRPLWNISTIRNHHGSSWTTYTIRSHHGPPRTIMDYLDHLGSPWTFMDQLGPSWTICTIWDHPSHWGPPGPYTTTRPVRNHLNHLRPLRSSPTTLKQQGSPSFQGYCKPPQTIPNCPVSGFTWEHLGLRVDQFRPSGDHRRTSIDHGLSWTTQDLLDH